MMAGWCTSGALLLVLMTGASYCYPKKQGFDPSSSSSSSYVGNLASTGSQWEVPSSGSAPAASRPQLGTAPHREPSYSQSSLQKDPATSYSSNVFAAPQAYASSLPEGSPYQSSFQPSSTEAVAPPSAFSGEETSVHQFSSGPSNVSPPGPPMPQFQGGELSKWENVYEFGNSESETEDQGFPPPPPGFQPFPASQALPEASHSEPLALSPVRNWYGYPYYYDYMFLTGQYPPGTVSHFSSSYEQGRDNWQNAHYIRDYLPSEPADPVFHAPKPVGQSISSTSNGKGGAMPGHNQPSGAAGHQGGYSQSSPGGHGLRKVAY